MSISFNYYTVFDNNFTPFKFIEADFKAKGIDIKTKCGLNPFYHEDMGIFVPMFMSGVVLGYIHHPVNKGQLNYFTVFDQPTVDHHSKDNSLKLLPQTVKVLTNTPLGTRLCSDNFVNYHGHGEMAIKLRPQEVMKAIVLGYLSLPSDQSLLNYLSNRYDVKDALAAHPNASLQKKAELIYAAINRDNQRNRYNYDGIGKTAGFRLSRTAKAFDKDHVIKWRKPPGNSAWPWTLDHHWFEIQESPITLSNYTFKSLLSGTGASESKKSKIDNQYPIFSRKLNLEHGRKILEMFFEDTLGKRSNGAWTNVVQMTNNMRWVSDNPCYVVPKLCLVMGVVPVFDNSAKFVKFAPMQNNIKLPTKKLYVPFENFNIDQGNDLSPFLVSTIALCYELGLVSLDTVETYFGIVNAGKALENNSNYMKTPIGEHVICCIPKTFSYDVSAKALAKHNAKNESEKDSDLETSDTSRYY